MTTWERYATERVGIVATLCGLGNRIDDASQLWPSRGSIMPYLISNLLEGQRKPVTVKPDTPIANALLTMVENDFSQLPVVDANNLPLGMVTNQSILSALSNFGVRLEELCAKDAIVRADTFQPEDDLFDVLSRLQENNAVLIVDDSGRVTGIVTDWDSMAYFQRRAEDMMLIEDIEVMLRNIVQSVYSNDGGQIDEKRMREIAKRIGMRNKTFERFSMAEVVAVFLHDESWAEYGSRFTLSRDAIKRLLDNVRSTRNQLAHFRGETSPQQRQQLRFCMEWLARYHDQIVSTGAEAVTTQPAEVSPATPGAREEEEPAPGESRYARLAIWLENRPGEEDVVDLTFNQIEDIIEGELPESAHKHRAWWANDSVSHPQSKLWLDVGWRAASANMSEQRVRFARIQERQRRYIDFYSKLLGELSKQPGFEALRPSPDGVSWHWVRSVSIRDQNLGYFGYSFGRGNIFRVELYLDTGDREKNKQNYDGLHKQREEIETKLGQELSWERLDSRRAARIAWVVDGNITDTDEELSALRQHAVPAMVRFVAEMEPRLKEVAREVV
jgi:CBS domain-containing protein